MVVEIFFVPQEATTSGARRPGKRNPGRMAAVYIPRKIAGYPRLFPEASSCTWLSGIAECKPAIPGTNVFRSVISLSSLLSTVHSRRLPTESSGVGIPRCCAMESESAIKRKIVRFLSPVVRLPTAGPFPHPRQKRLPGFAVETHSPTFAKPLGSSTDSSNRPSCVRTGLVEQKALFKGRFHFAYAGHRCGREGAG